MRKFKEGDIVKLVKYPPNPFMQMSAPIGSTAKVVGYKQGYLQIKWIDKGNTLQSDGGYDEGNFRKVEQMKLEVGKKYLDEVKTPVLIIGYSSGGFPVVEWPGGIVLRITNDVSNLWKEYKEPRKLVKWGRVYQGPDGRLFFGIASLDSDEEARKRPSPNFVDTYKVEWEENVSS